MKNVIAKMTGLQNQIIALGATPKPWPQIVLTAEEYCETILRPQLKELQQETPGEKADRLRQHQCRIYAGSMYALLRRWQSTLEWQFNQSALYPERSIRGDDWEELVEATREVLEKIDR